MCVSYTRAEWSERVHGTRFPLLRHLERKPASAEVVPADDAPVLLQTARGRSAQWLRWGLVPSWAPRRPDDPHVNARSESAAQKRAFADSWVRRRCAVPVDGFHEWRRSPSGGTRFRIERTDGRPFALAGLWDAWRGLEGEWLCTFAVLTRKSSALVAPIHGRMPVLLPERYEGLWIDPATSSTTLRALMSAEDGQGYRVVPDPPGPVGGGPRGAAGLRGFQ